MGLSIRLLAVTLFAAGICPASPPDQERPSQPAFPDGGVGEMFQRFDSFDWDAEGQRAGQAVAQLWHRNGWTGESDIFARDIAAEVAKIPPWEVTMRLNLMTGRMAERYGLSEEQSMSLQRSLLREAAGFLVKNSGVLIEYGNEAISARAAGRPYTPEQVRRWSSAVEPLLADGQAMADRLAKELEAEVPAEKKQLLHRDMQSYEKRTQYIREMSARWAQGHWKPEDWGLEDDPIQTGRLTPAALRAPLDQSPAPLAAAPVIAEPVVTIPEPVETPVAAIPTKWVAHEPGTWIAYVMHVEKRFRFDEGQKSAASSIHAELVTRATDFLTAHRNELAAVPHSNRPTHPGYEPVTVLFSELQARLDALPTTTQRASPTQ